MYIHLRCVLGGLGHLQVLLIILIKILALHTPLPVFVSPDLSVFFSPSPLSSLHPSSRLSPLNLLPPSSSSSISLPWLRVKLPLDVLSCSLLSCCRTETWLRLLQIMTPEKEWRMGGWEMGREIEERTERAQERLEIKEMYSESREG